MTVPRTPLLCAPDGADDLLGRTILSSTLIATLRRLNPRIVVPEPNDAANVGVFKGITAMWIGSPGTPGSKKICAFHLGAVPEWTQIDSEGVMIARGWRGIFEKVIRSGAATRHQIERAFRVTLDEGGVDGLCGKCVRSGRRERHNGGKWRMCDMHEQVYSQMEQDRKRREVAADPAIQRRMRTIFS